MLLSLPTYLFSQQPFLAFGDVTGASVILAILTGLLPVSLMASIIISFKLEVKGSWAKADVISLLLALQLCCVLWVWEQLPLVFLAIGSSFVLCNNSRHRDVFPSLGCVPKQS
jgi:hypothetical protein